MSTIEQAVARLEALRNAGVDITTEQTPLPASSPADDDITQEIELDLATMAARGFITPQSPRSRMGDEFRVLKRPVIDNARGRGASAVKNGNLVMVTSSLPGEGKSFSSINLAMSLAQEQDSTVLLVDADVARPSVMRMFGLKPARGLMDVLSGEAKLPEVLLKTNVDKLTLLPAGMPHERATEMLASRSMAALLREMGSRYEDRIIVFDSPPLLATTEARVLATHMGQVLVVVEAERISTGILRQALSTIEACPVKLMVLNKASPMNPGAYGYGKAYGAYGYGAPL